MKHQKSFTKNILNFPATFRSQEIKMADQKYIPRTTCQMRGQIRRFTFFQQMKSRDFRSSSVKKLGRTRGITQKICRIHYKFFTQLHSFPLHKSATLETFTKCKVPSRSHFNCNAPICFLSKEERSKKLLNLYHRAKCIMYIHKILTINVATL